MPARPSARQLLAPALFSLLVPTGAAGELRPRLTPEAERVLDRVAVGTEVVLGDRRLAEAATVEVTPPSRRAPAIAFTLDRLDL